MVDDVLTVLVVEDDSGVRQTLGDLLEERGFRVRTAEDVEGAVRAASAADPPAVAVIDLTLPEADSVDLVARLRDVSSPMEAVILTEEPSADPAVRGIRERSHDYLTRPPDPDRLVETVERAGERWRRKRAELRLAESESRFRSIFGAIVDAVVVTDEEGRILDANPAAEELSARSLGELRARSLNDLLGARAPAFQTGRWPSDQHDGEAGLHTLERPDGETRVVEVRSTEFGAGRSVHSVRDITVRKQLEEQLHRAQRMEAVGQLAGGLAHDFNNLLMAIGGYADLLTDALSDRPEALQDLNAILQATDRAARLTQQLLAFGRRQVLNPRILDPNQVVAAMERMLRQLLREDIELEVDLAGQVGTVRADRAQLEHVIVNLAVNARDAMPEGGRLTVRTYADTVSPEAADQAVYDLQEGEYVVLEVEDTGHGMDADTVARAFEPFYSTRETERATGLGLATVYGIVKQSGGYVWAESSPGEGARFRVLLPRLEEPATVDPDSRWGSARSLVGSETVLVADDDRSVRQFVRRSLERQGYEVLVTGGASALDTVDEHEGEIHLVVADVVMAEMGGREIAARVRERHPDARVILTSGHTPDAPGDAVPTNGAPVLRKPFTSESLFRVVRGTLDGEKPDAG